MQCESVKATIAGQVGQVGQEHWLEIDGRYRAMLDNGQALVVESDALLHHNIYVAKLLLLTDRGWQVLIEHSDTKPEDLSEQEYIAARPLTTRVMAYAQHLYADRLHKPLASTSASKSNPEIWLEIEGCYLARLGDGRSLMIQPDQWRGGDEFDARLLVLTETGWACQQEYTAIKPQNISNDEFRASLSIAERLMDFAKYAYPDGLEKPTITWKESLAESWQWQQERLHTRLVNGQTLMIVPDHLYCGSEYIARLSLLTTIGWRQLMELRANKPAHQSADEFVSARSLARRLMRYAHIVYQQ